MAIAGLDGGPHWPHSSCQDATELRRTPPLHPPLASPGMYCTAGRLTSHIGGWGAVIPTWSIPGVPGIGGFGTLSWDWGNANYSAAHHAPAPHSHGTQELEGTVQRAMPHDQQMDFVSINPGEQKESRVSLRCAAYLICFAPVGS